MYQILLFRRCCLFLAKLEAKRTLLFTIPYQYSNYKTTVPFKLRVFSQRIKSSFSFTNEKVDRYVDLRFT